MHTNSSLQQDWKTHTQTNANELKNASRSGEFILFVQFHFDPQYGFNISSNHVKNLTLCVHSTLKNEYYLLCGPGRNSSKWNTADFEAIRYDFPRFLRAFSCLALSMQSYNLCVVADERNRQFCCWISFLVCEKFRVEMNSDMDYGSKFSNPNSSSH